MTAPWRTRVRTAFAVLLGLYGIVLLRTGLVNAEDAGLLHTINLPIHETGHLVFMPFGELWQLLGGSLFQIIVPLLFAGEFARRRDPYAAFVCLWWVAQNCWDVSIYIGDARARALPLLGDDPDNHDWFNILGLWDRLDRDTLYAARVRGVGTVLYLVAVIGALWAAPRAPVNEA